MLLEITVLARVAECLEIKIDSAVNQICRFASTKKTETLPKTYRGLPQASHGKNTGLPSPKFHSNLLLFIVPVLEK